ncbi:HvfC/BufC N-terminal domain-containing protein [Roseovarius pelagicus]|uniref:DNA-binding domain-containing protein n=1 Tax=Roseovarius pelagicus TaxID=2980108 RepID=A0ABY6DDX8_9RHOB|nr:DNA-binding domain-containing protein [Roseovarius pelagicus]UXX84346.1 DNA-binding domain-containing protein [Roseovarius pelagicus]
MSVGQAQFREAIFDATRPAPVGLTDGLGRVAGARFDVYRNNVAVGLTEVLQTGFPVIRKLLGEENFQAISGVFLRRHPPTSPVLFQYGSDFPVFLRNFEPLAHLGYLHDVATLEMAIRQSYHAADAVPIPAERLAEIPAEQLGDLRLGFAPALRVLRSPWPLFDLWAYNARDGHPKPRPASQDVMITRPEFDPLPHLLLPGGADFIEALMAGRTLGDAAETAQRSATEFDLTAVLGLMLAGNAITSAEY